MSRLYLGMLGRLYFLLASGQARSVKIALAHLHRTRQYLPTVKKMWPGVRAGIFEHYHEKLLLGFKPYEHSRTQALERVGLRGGEHLEQALAQGRGVILVTGHFGAVEYIPGALSWRGVPVSVMVHCKSPELRRRLEEKAVLAGTQLLDPKVQATFFQAVEHLKQGRVLMTQCDEINQWRPYADRSIDFLGVRMGLDRSLDLLARKSGAPVVFALMHRLGGGRYELEVEPVSPPRQGGELVSAQCLALLSQRIYAAPAAWYEWKKLAPYLQPQGENAAHADCWLLPVPGEVAVPNGCST